MRELPEYLSAADLEALGLEEPFPPTDLSGTNGQPVWERQAIAEWLARKEMDPDDQA